MEDTIAILRGLKERYEVHHGVRIQDTALIAAATLSHRYIADRFLPDKAIDLIDEAASQLRIEIDSMPTEIDEVERRDHAARDRARRRCARRGTRPRRSAARRSSASWRELREQSAAMKAAVAAREGADPAVERAQAAARGGARRGRAGRARRRSAARGRAALRRDPGARTRDRASSSSARTS